MVENLETKLVDYAVDRAALGVRFGKKEFLNYTSNCFMPIVPLPHFQPPPPFLQCIYIYVSVGVHIIITITINITSRLYRHGRHSCICRRQLTTAFPA